MTALYQLSHQYAELQKLQDSDDEDLASAIANTLDGIGGEISEKAEALVTLVLNMDADVTAVSAEIARLNARKAAIVKRQDSMRDYLRENMESAGISKISCPLFSITCAKGREVAVIDSEEYIPDEYMRVKTEIAPDKNKIASALKAGVDVPGARLERSKSAIRIK